MLLIYVASPYTNVDPAIVLKNVETSMEVGDKLIKLGYAPYLPLLTHYQHILYPQSYDLWLKLGFEMVKRCDALLRLPGISPGGDAEVALALKLNKPVAYSIEDLRQKDIKRDA
jgi:Domain of unknown function (DUF4406)